MDSILRPVLQTDMSLGGYLINSLLLKLFERAAKRVFDPQSCQEHQDRAWKIVSTALCLINFLLSRHDRIGHMKTIIIDMFVFFLLAQGALVHEVVGVHRQAPSLEVLLDPVAHCRGA